MKEPLLFSPGPVPCEYNIKIDFSHRSQKYTNLYKETEKELKLFTGKEYMETLFIQGSASSAIDTLANLFEGKEVLVLVNGTFGERMKDMVLNVNKTVGVARDIPQAIKSIIKTKPDIFMMVQFETSNSTFNNTLEIEKVCQLVGTKLMVDCVSSFPFYCLPNADFIVLSSSKQLRGLPAMGIILYNPRSILSFNAFNQKTDYLNFWKYAEYAQKYQTPHTSLIPQMISLRDSLKKGGDIISYTYNIGSKCKILSKGRTKKMIGDKIAPVLTFKVKNIKMLQKHLKKNNIIPYYNASYMGSIVQFSMFNYKMEEYRYLNKILIEAEVEGWL